MSTPQPEDGTTEQPLDFSIVSPFSTGGGGPDLERQVGAYYLALLLLGAPPFGLPAGVTQELRWQRAFQGEPLDDLIVQVELPTGDARLALQIKRDLTFGEKDETFREVMGAAWRTFTGAFTPGADRIGLVLGLYSKQVDEYFQTTLTWARVSASAADFLERIGTRRFSHQSQRSFVVLVRTALDRAAGRAISDDELWDFLRSLVLLRFDLLNDPSRDRAGMVLALQGILPAPERNRAAELFDRLVDYAAEASRSGGSFSADILHQRLTSDGFLLEPPANARPDLQRLRDHADFVVRDIRTRIGAVELGRVDVLTTAMEGMRERALLEITGPPGIGKSAMLRALVEAEQARGPVLVLSADRITAAGWDAFAAELQLDLRLPALLVALGSHPEPCIFLDGADRITAAGSRRVVNDLMRGLAAHEAAEGGSTRWRVVLTARDTGLRPLHDWLDCGFLGEPGRVQVPELTEDEVAEVTVQLPRLRPLLAADHLTPILRNPLLLDLIADPRISAAAGTLPPVATEIEVSSTWWDRVVGGDDAAGQARRLGLLALGERVVAAPGRRLPPQGIDFAALVSLEADRILLRDPGRDVFGFGHDVLEEWVLYRTLDQHREEIVPYLSEKGQPLGLLRAVQLLGCFLLERGEVAGWERLLRAVEGSPDLAPRWRQALLGAPLLSTRAGELLDRMEPVLFEQDGRRLRELLVALRTSEVAPNPLLSPVAESLADNPHEREALLLSVPLPDWWVWLPILQWVLIRAEQLPRKLRPEVTQAMLLWQRSTPADFPLRQTVAHVALSWLREAEERPR